MTSTNDLAVFGTKEQEQKLKNSISSIGQDSSCLSKYYSKFSRQKYDLIMNYG